MVERIYFNHIKEKTDGYFLEYSPPVGSIPFASLTVTYVSDITAERAATDLEDLTKEWITRYPVPVMASAFDRQGDLVDLESVRPISHLITTMEKGKPRHRWDLFKDEEFPEALKDPEYLIQIYSDLNYRTQSEVSAQARENMKPIRTARRLLIVWSVFVPLVIALLEFFSPVWLSVIALAYSFWKAYQQWLKMTGRKKKSDREIEREEDARLKEHHHYHCKLNPDGFLKLKIDNLRKMEEDQIQQEYDSISSSN
ncbi:hypothetical protein [Litchfieldella xinjiangensis]|uniref:hypothetical protein n=1 Tax=Litchfieldella xinjiangensis TaxID=1166948 RepID=UPI0012E03A6D|nr:hypothetical protein [Halomonas xinjiangensis]